MLLVVLVLVFYFVANSITSFTGFIVSELDSDFENCLQKKDIVLYVDNYDVMKLREMKTSDYLGSVKVSGCVLNKLSCIREGITVYPTWVINGEKVEGDIDLYKFADLAGCDLV
jgi:hypothetical protein